MEKVRISLAAARVNAGYSQKKIAELLGVTTNAVYQWERNMTKPRPDRAKRMAELYGIALDDIFFTKPRELNL